MEPSERGRNGSSICLSCCRRIGPTCASTGLPFANTMNVGTDCTRSDCASIGDLSMFTFTTFALPASSVATASTSGASPGACASM